MPCGTVIVMDACPVSAANAALAVPEIFTVASGEEAGAFPPDCAAELAAVALPCAGELAPPPIPPPMLTPPTPPTPLIIPLMMYALLEGLIVYVDRPSLYRYGSLSAIRRSLLTGRSSIPGSPIANKR